MSSHLDALQQHLRPKQVFVQREEFISVHRQLQQGRWIRSVPRFDLDPGGRPHCALERRLVQLETQIHHLHSKIDRLRPSS